MEACSVVLVPSTGHAIRLEKLLHEISISCKLIPVPRHLSSDCGVCVRIARNDEERTRSLLEKHGLEHEGIHEI